MTITRYDGIAIFPKRCDKCNRLFWLEPYNTNYKYVLIGCPIKYIKCIECIEKEESEE